MRSVYIPCHDLSIARTYINTGSEHPSQLLAFDQSRAKCQQKKLSGSSEKIRNELNFAKVSDIMNPVNNTIIPIVYEDFYYWNRDFNFG